VNKVSANDGSDRELEGGISDDEPMSHRIPESNVKVTHPLATKNVEPKDADPG